MNALSNLHIIPMGEDMPTLLYSSANPPTGYRNYKIDPSGKRVEVSNKDKKYVMRTPNNIYQMNTQTYGMWTYWTQPFGQAMTGMAIMIVARCR